ncbi:MAG: hypothetical protein AAGA97_00780 [Pseudomonadota bacterium]|mgnify:CR=1 FL=1
MADNDVVSSNAVYEILEEWEAYLKDAGYEVDDFAVDKSASVDFEEPQP